MHLSRLSLHNFRNYKQLELVLQPGLFVFYGDNAQGKTNLLEAVGMLATGSSFHASSDREVVYWLAAEQVARVDGVAKRREDEIQVDIAIFDPTPTPPRTSPEEEPAHAKNLLTLPANASRKRYKVNGVPKKAVDIIGQFKVVLFAPLDLHLVDGSP